MKHTLFLLTVLCIILSSGCDKRNNQEEWVDINGIKFPVYIGHFADYVHTNGNGNILGDVKYGRHGNTYDWELLEYHGNAVSDKGYLVDPCLSDETYSKITNNVYSGSTPMSDKTKTPEKPLMPPIYIEASITPNYHVEISCYFYPGDNAIGFNIYRSATYYLTDAVKINQTLLECGDNSLEPSIYSYYDENVELTHTYYYWLEKIDTSHNSSLYGPVYATVIYTGPEPILNKIYPAYPNPCTNGFTLPFSITESADMHILILNQQCEVVRDYSESKERGSTSEYINTSEFPAGLYRVYYWIKMQNKTYYSYGDVLKQ